MIPSSFSLIFQKYTNMASNTANNLKKVKELFFQQNNDFQLTESYFTNFGNFGQMVRWTGQEASLPVLGSFFKIQIWL